MKNSSATDNSFFRSLHFTFLSLFMALALVPVILFSVINFLQARADLIKRADSNLEQMGQVQHQRITNWLENVKTEVALLAKDDQIIAMDPQEAVSPIRAFDETIPGLEAVILADPTGRIIAANANEALSINITDRGYFQKAREGQANFSEALVSRQSGDIVIARAEPVLRNGKVVGVLAVITPTSKITQMLEEMWTGKTTDAYLINRDGLLLTQPALH